MPVSYTLVHTGCCTFDLFLTLYSMPTIFSEGIGTQMIVLKRKTFQGRLQYPKMKKIRGEEKEPPNLGPNFKHCGIYSMYQRSDPPALNPW